MAYLSAPTPREARRRSTALALAVLAHALLIWLLFHLGPPTSFLPVSQSSLSTFNVAKEPGSKPKAEHQRRQARPKAKAAAKAARPAAAPRPTPPAEAAPSNLALFGRNKLFAGGDIGRIPRADAGEGEVADSGAGEGKGGSYGPGAGPGGARLYAAQWYRRPTHAELAGYLPHHDIAPGSWGDIACKTIPNNQVESCQQLGDSPPGSGIARALRQAAWQFRIVPPRVNGRPLIGAWVRIHFYFTDDGDVAAK